MKMVVSKEKDKIGSLFNLICSLKSQSAIVFCNHRDAAERISDTLNEKEFMPPIIMVEWIRMKENALNPVQKRKCELFNHNRFRPGLDIPEMNHVIHYHLPSKEDEFTHRNGRTARMLAWNCLYHCS
jgi:superfamily II DNA/RNA helicase